MGICEEHQATTAAGMAAGGLRPVVAVYSTFLQRAIDGVIHDAALQGLPVVFALDRAGVVPGDGATHHGVFDLALLRPIPGLTLMAPRTVSDLGAMLRLALSLPGPSALRYPRGLAPAEAASPKSQDPRPAAAPPPQVGVAVELSRTGENPTVAVWTLGPHDDWAARVAKALKARGVDSIHVDARFAKPVDAALLRAQADAGVRVFLALEDGIRTGGFGTAVLEALADHPARPRVLRFGWPDEFLPHASSLADLLERCRLRPEDAAAAVLAAL